jgi:hypothetical protein
VGPTQYFALLPPGMRHGGWGQRLALLKLGNMSHYIVHKTSKNKGLYDIRFHVTRCMDIKYKTTFILFNAAP